MKYFRSGVYNKEEENNLFGLITDEQYSYGIYEGLVKRRILWQKRLQGLRTKYLPEINKDDFVYIPYKIGEKFLVGKFTISENTFDGIAFIMENELAELIKYLAKIKKSEYGDILIFQPFSITDNIINHKILSISKNAITKMPTLDIYKYSIKYKINKNQEFKFDRSNIKTLSNKETYLEELAEMIDDIYFCLDENNKELTYEEQQYIN